MKRKKLQEKKLRKIFELVEYLQLNEDRLKLHESPEFLNLYWISNTDKSSKYDAKIQEYQKEIFTLGYNPHPKWLFNLYVASDYNINSQLNIENSIKSYKSILPGSVIPFEKKYSESQIPKTYYAPIDYILNKNKGKIFNLDRSDNRILQGNKNIKHIHPIIINKDRKKDSINHPNINNITPGNRGTYNILNPKIDFTWTTMHIFLQKVGASTQDIKNSGIKNTTLIIFLSCNLETIRIQRGVSELFLDISVVTEVTICNKTSLSNQHLNEWDSVISIPPLFWFSELEYYYPFKSHLKKFFIINKEAIKYNDPKKFWNDYKSGKITFKPFSLDFLLKKRKKSEQYSKEGGFGWAPLDATSSTTDLLLMDTDIKSRHFQPDYYGNFTKEIFKLLR